MRVSQQTVPLQATPAAIPKLPRMPFPDLLDHLTAIGQGLLLKLACAALICALVVLNASFAWELGREAEQFRLAFAMGLAALDVMRPFFVLKAFQALAARNTSRAIIGFSVAFFLAPVSILSSTAILSSAFKLGAEMNADENIQLDTLSSIRRAYSRKLAEAERLQRAWETECNRGGCGPKVAQIEDDFLQANDEAQSLLGRIATMTDTTGDTSDLLARMTSTFEDLGLFSGPHQLLLPLFLALSLELGALFGPALRTARKKGK